VNKFIKPVFGVLFILAFGYKSFGQRRVPIPVERYRPPMGMPVHHNNQMNGQPRPGRRIELIKEGYINIRLKLTPDEARAFWPVYHQYVQEQTAVRILKRENNSKTSPDGTQQIDRELEYETELVDIRKHYKEEFLKILPPEKVSELYKSEREFNDEMLNILKEQTIRAGN
jgi:hypothetical protein